MVSRNDALYRPAPAQPGAGLGYRGQVSTTEEHQMQYCLGCLPCDSMLILYPIVS